MTIVIATILSSYLRMQGRIKAGGLLLEVQLLDIRDLDGSLLLESDTLDENMMSVLARQPDTRRATRRIAQERCRN